jgi:hypothetical protein
LPAIMLVSVSELAQWIGDWHRAIRHRASRTARIFIGPRLGRVVAAASGRLVAGRVRVGAGLPITKRGLRSLSCSLGARRWWGSSRRLSLSLWLLCAGLRCTAAHAFKGTVGILLDLGVCRRLLLGSWRHPGAESRVPSLSSRLSSRLGVARWLVSARRCGKLLADILPRIALDTRRAWISRCSAKGSIVCILSLGVREDLVGRLNDLKLGVDLLFATRVAVWVVFECCKQVNKAIPCQMCCSSHLACETVS